MDWKRAKTVLILMFLTLNIFLIYNIYYKESQTIDISEREIMDIKAILDMKNIDLKANIPAKVKPKSFLKVEDNAYDEHELVQSFFGNTQEIEKEKFENNIRYKKNGKVLEIYSNRKIIFNDTNPLGNIKGLDKNEIIKYVEDYLKLKGFLPKYSILQRFNQVGDNYEITFKQEYKGYRIYASNIKVNISDKGITHLEILWFTPLQFVEEAKIIKSPLDILLVFAKDIQNTEKVTITNITLGYYIPAEETKNASIYAIPVWEIETSKGVFYYNGYEGYLENNIK